MIKEWFTAAELAALKLPALASTVQGINAKARREHWKEQVNLARQPLARRRKSGGGFEYHYTVLPGQAQLKLVDDDRRRDAKAQVSPKKVTKDDIGRDEMWRWYDGLPANRKKKAERRLRILESVLNLERGGMLKNSAVHRLSDAEGVGASTIWSWFELVAGKSRNDWLPYLAPRNTGRTKTVECDPRAWEALKADYLRQAKPPFQVSYERAKAIADDQGWQIPSARTLERRMENEVPAAVKVLLRDGEDALKRMYPPQERDRSMMHALEAVNIDGHKWDVFVRWPDGTVARPIMVAIQDLYSNKCLAWRIDRTENTDVVRLALADVFRDFGLFDHIYMDNGRAFASKYVSGGTSNRFRFKVKAEEPTGILTTLGIGITWTRPYSGQSKPIERMFRDFCERIAKHPKFEGAYTGNKPDAKPENYGTKAVPLDEFLAVVDQGIRLHNAKPNRRTRVCGGTKSFDQVFDESYANALIRKCSDEQLRMCLMAAESVRADRRSGSVRLLDNRYWSEFLHDQIGKPLTIRFDPDNLHDGVHVYRLDGAYLGFAECIEAAGFADADAARTHARKYKQFRRAAKEAADLERQMSLDELSRLLPDVDERPAPETKVVRMFNGSAALKQQTETDSDADEEQDFDFSTAFSNGLRLIEPENDL